MACNPASQFLGITSDDIENPRWNIRCWCYLSDQERRQWVLCVRNSHHRITSA